MARGGSFNNNTRNLRAAYRNNNRPDERNNNIGFRCLRDVDFVPEPVWFTLHRECVSTSGWRAGRFGLAPGVEQVVTENPSPW